MPKRKPADDAPEPEHTEEPTTPESQGPTHDQLYAEATELRIKGRARMSPVELEQAVQAAKEGLLELEDQEPETPVVEPGPSVTESQARNVMQSTSPGLLALRNDPSLTPAQKQFVETEIARREQLAGVKLAREQLRGHLDRFVVTKGGMYVSRDGQITQLPIGSMVTPNTHDLAHVSSQGIEYQACGEPVVAWDELGRPYTKLPGAPEQKPLKEPEWLPSKNEERK